MSGPRVWPVFATYVLAFLTIIALSILAAVVVREIYPDIPERQVFDGLPGLIAGGVASSLGLLVTLTTAVRPLVAERLRLVPGRERARDLVVVVLGVLGLGQALDSLTALTGVADRGSMATIRHAVFGASGAELFAAVLVIGVLAGVAEETFFRGYVQTRLRQRWPAGVAVVVASAAFAVMHFEWIHGALAFALGLYLGFVTERTGSALPAIVAHVVNNTLFTLTTAAFGSLGGVPLNAVLLAGGVTLFLACVLELRRAFPVAAPPA